KIVAVAVIPLAPVEPGIEIRAGRVGHWPSGNWTIEELDPERLHRALRRHRICRGIDIDNECPALEDEPLRRTRGDHHRLGVERIHLVIPTAECLPGKELPRGVIPSMIGPRES